MATAPALDTVRSLIDLPRHCPAAVNRVDWHALSEPEARRLREFGLDEGIEIALLHRSGVWGGPVGVRIGRMTVALRRHVAAAIHVSADGG
ncbi:FeoA family protein [Sphingosinithalassobacter sp. CS137]|uniref:FeoA family protein n=1 Tax=Sphingosinithalassobacter sp. CS137 TaxID=2762748 RepID=UPI00165E166C|nr:FeoA family protein [Sphingosinithalassobacter sp. CS137]